MRVILASTSPRRHELFALLQIPFELTVPSYVEQSIFNVAPIDQARSFAEGKAKSCRDLFPQSIIIGCDTLIDLGSEILGKPRDTHEAADMLQRLSGRQHLIHTGLAVLSTETTQIRSCVESVHVYFKSLAPSDVRAYLATKESLGKAGAYAIQGRGAELIEYIEGDYPAAVGLPLRLLTRLLCEHKIITPVDIEDIYNRKPYPNWDRFSETTGPLD